MHAGQDARLVPGRHPVQRRPADHHVEALGRERRGEVLRGDQLEGLVARRDEPGLVEHRRLRVDADDGPLGHQRGDLCGEVAGAATHVEHALVATQRERRQEPVVVHAVVGRVARVAGPVPLGDPMFGPARRGSHILRFSS